MPLLAHSMTGTGNAIMPPQVRTYLDTGRLANRPQGNEYDLCLAHEKSLWDEIVSCGLGQVCCPQGREPYYLKPYIAMPDSGRRFREIGSINAGANIPLTGTSTVSTLSFRVPTGYDGVIDTVICGLTPPAGGNTGFIEGSGVIVWRVAADAIAQPRYLRNLGNVQYSLGSLTVPVPTPNSSLRIYSGDLVNFYTAISSAAMGVISPGAQIVVSLGGWYYSR